MKNKKQQQKNTPVKKAIKAAAVKKDDNWSFKLPAALILILLAFIAFYPCLANGLTNWDDGKYIIYNPLIREFTGENIKRIFSEVYFSNYQPLHIFSYLVEYQFFKLDGTGYHLVSILMHSINILLVLWMAWHFSKNKYITFFTALFFAITPMRVESVAWAAERKDLLYSMFFFAALISYLLYHQHKFNTRYYILTILFFILSVFSKTMAVSLVPVLFLVDFYYNRKLNSKLILEKIPLIVIAVVMGIISINASKETGSIDTSGVFTTIDRIFFACQNLLMYAGKLIYPYGMISYYSYPPLVNGHIPTSYYISGGVIVLLAALVIWSMKKGKLIFFGTGFFLSTVALVLMIIPVGPAIFSERYTYIPSVMFYFMLIFYLFKWIEKNNSKQWKMVVSGLLIAYSLFLVQMTRARCLVWKDGLTLWNDVIQKDQTNADAYFNRGDEFNRRGEFNNAISDFRQAVIIRPEFPDPYAGLCQIYRSMAKYDSALYFANRCLALEPDKATVLNDRGVVRAMMNNPDSAMMDFDRAILLKPEMSETYGNRGQLHCSLGKFDKGLEDFSMAIKINPDFTEAYFNVGLLLKMKNNFDEAIRNFNVYLQKGGKNPKAFLLLGQCYAEKNDFLNAISFARQARAAGIQEADQYINQWSQKNK